MITIKRDKEVIIEDGYKRISVNEEGGGFLHVDGEVIEVELHEPIYLRAAQNAGLAVTDRSIALGERAANERWFG